MAKHSSNGTKTVDPDVVASAFAKSVAEGDIVNFRLLFASFSPARSDSTETFALSKYAYLLPQDEQVRQPEFAAARELVRSPETWAHIERELNAKRPAQLPAELVMRLADNAVREGKWTSAAQAYELLRIRRRMKDEFIRQGLAALEEGKIREAVRGLRIGAGLAYDYAAFPEPLPMVPQYQTRALMLHALYPMRQEDCLALYDPDRHVQVALDYLLFDGDTAGRVREIPLEQRVALVKELIRQTDPHWEQFVSRYSEACRHTQEIGQRLREVGRHEAATLKDEIEEQQAREPWDITRALLGRDVPGGEWWQYLKELAYEHPAAILFISRQVIGEHEILMPRLRAGSPLATALGLDNIVAEAANTA